MRRRQALAHGVVSVVSAVCLELRTEGGSVPSLVAFRRGDSKAGGIAILGPELARETTTRPGMYDQTPTSKSKVSGMDCRQGDRTFLLASKHFTLSRDRSRSR